MRQFSSEGPRSSEQLASQILQRKCAHCGESGGGGCSTCAENDPAGGVLAPEIVHNVLRASGEPLDPRLRNEMEQRFAHDFSGVRVHTDATAAASASAVAATAYTVGGHIAFAHGAYQPNSAGGMRVIAHELAHVIQQGGRAVDSGAPIRIGSEQAPEERSADYAADQIMLGNVTAVAGDAAPTLRRQPAEQGGVPCALDAYRAHTRTIDLQPIVFRSSAADPSPTGASWSRRFAPSNRIWNKVGVTFNTLSTITLTDATNKTRGSTDAEANTIGGLHAGAGIEIYMVDNPMTSSGGASTLSAGTASNIVMSDGGTSDTLMAHELGHVLGLGHPPAASDANTIMTPSGSRDAANPERNTVGNYNRITYPADAVATCIKPDA